MNGMGNEGKAGEKKFALQDARKKMGETDESIVKEEDGIGPSDAPLFSAPGCVRCVASENLHTPANTRPSVCVCVCVSVCVCVCVISLFRTLLHMQKVVKYVIGWLRLVPSSVDRINRLSTQISIVNSRGEGKASIDG